MRELLAQLPGHLAAHLGLSLAALVAGIVVSVPLGILVTRVRRFEVPVVGAASVLQTIPSLALLAFMVPALAALGVRSIGFLPALIGLSLYSILPILRNTVTGLSGVDPAVIEAARGVGMTPRESLFRVELPLAMPVIVAGIRTSAVWTVGTATLSTPVGAPSLGNYIFSGLQTRNYASVLVGCVASAVLALVIDGLVHVISMGIERQNRRLSGLGVAGFLLLGAFAVTPFWQSRAADGHATVTIGAKTFTESYILAHILAGQAEKQTGSPAKVLESLGSTVAFDALASGQIDMYVDYSGTLWSSVLGKGETRTDRKTMLSEVGRMLDEKYGILLVCPFGFENTYALAMRRQDAARLGARRIGDLAPHAKTLRVGGDYEMFQRSEWKSVTSTYGLVFAEQRSMDPSLMYDAVKTGQADLIGAFSTDGRIAAYDLVVLEDDRGALPPYDAVILASARLRREKPAVIEALRALCGHIDAETMRNMNREVDEKKRAPAAVAKEFLQELR
jgi:osmoprotectant transport system permease protein